MSSTSNVQNLLVNVVRPTYRWESGTGFVPSVVVSNVTELIAGKVITDALVVSDSNVNTFIGSNAGCNATMSFNNVGIGFQAMAGVVNADSNVAVGSVALEGFSNGSNNTVIGAGADITAGVDSNIIIGTNTQITGGTNSIVIGNGITWSTGDSINIKNSIYGSNGRIGIGTVVPSQPLDVCGLAYFRDKVGIQVLNPTYSLDVLGTAYATTRFLTGAGSTPTTPAYSFCNVTTTGVYQTSDASYGSGALGVSILGTPRVVVSGTKTYIYGDLDVCGAFSAVSGGAGGGGGGTIASNGTAAAPAFTFSNDLSTGLHLGGTSYLAFDTSGVQRMCISGGFVGIGTPTPRVTLDVSGDISANVYNGPGGTQSAPHYTFSDDRTTGLFFPGANMVGFTAGGTERMRISNSNIGIGTTTPSNALDVAGTLRVIGGAGDITLTNGAIAIAGNTVVSSTGVLSNSSATSNSIGGVVLATSNVSAASFESSPSTLSTIGGVTLQNSNVGATRGAIAGITASNFIRNALTPTQFDISLGNISNSKTTISSNFIGTSTSSNSIGGVTIQNTQIFSSRTISASGLMVATGDDSTNNTLAYSTDYGVTWTGLGRTIFSTVGYIVAWNGTRWVAGGAGTNTLAYSSDGSNWTGLGTSIFSGGCRGIAWSGTRFVAVGNGTNTIAHSTDGITWTGLGTSIFSTGGNFVAYGGDYFVAVGDGATNTLAYSSDGMTWTGKGKVFSNYGTSVAYNGSLWVSTGVGSINTISIALNPTGSWSNATITNGSYGWSVAWNGTTWLLGAQGSSNIFSSSDGTSWTGQSNTNGLGTVFGISWNGTYWVATGSGTKRIAYSSDGTTWTSAATSSLFLNGGWGNASRNYVLPVTTGTIDGVEVLLDVSGGNLLIGGQAYKSGGGSWTSTSDRRLKNEIELADTSLCYSVVKSLPLKRFSWNTNYLPDLKDKRVVGWIAQDVEAVFPRAVEQKSEFGIQDLRYLDVDQIYKTMYGALEKVIADKEAMEAKFTKALARIAVLETALDISYAETVVDVSSEVMDVSGTVVDVSSEIMDVSGASLQSSELTQPTLPTPPPPEEPPVSEPEPQPQPSSEYAPAPEATEA